MARRKSNAPLSVVLNGRDVGTLTKASSGAIGFRYTPTWLEEKNAVPVSLSLPLREDGYVGEPVIAVFEYLLPDSKPVRESMAARFDAAARTLSACWPPSAATASVRCSFYLKAITGGLSNQAIQQRNGYTPERGSGPHARRKQVSTSRINSAFYMRRYWRSGPIVTFI